VGSSVQTRKLSGSQALFAAASELIPGGVTSAVRAGARPFPLYIERGEGPWIWDVDGNRYVDYALGYGPLLLGHAPAAIVEAVARQAAAGTTYGSQHRGEVELARLVTSVVPGAERIIFSNTGSEAVAAALRVARAATGRQRVLKFEGHYHGWLDGVFASTAFDPARSGPADAPETIPSTGGMSTAALADIVTAPWNDPLAVGRILDANAGSIAAIILEPVAVNGGLIPPDPGFLQSLRRLATAHGALLVFDEVITGFRLALGGAQQHYGIRADLAVFAKAMGGGVSISAVTGPAALMDLVATGRVVHNGTFNGNGLAMAAGIAAVGALSADPATTYGRLHALGARLAAGLATASPRLTVRQLGPIVHTAVDEPALVRSVRDRASGDRAAHARFIEALLGLGVHATPRGLWYVSTTHGEDEVDLTIEAARSAAAETLA
jgi:glutamate-1-semialdehyde 2,1-aminomutase